jgi:tetratricopeptide (TPR) repeat protein
MTMFRSRAMIGVALCGAVALAEPLSPERKQQVLADALRDYDAAAEVQATDLARAQQLYRQSAAGFEALIAAGIENAALEYNLGNASFRAGDLGRAILHYRRALRLEPSDVRVQANLRFARQRVEPAISPSGRTQVTETLLFWHYNSSPQRRRQVGIGLAAIGWTLLFAWLRWRRAALATGGIAAVALASIALASVLYEARERAVRPAAVVLERQVLRLGRSATADPAMKAPLGPGVEVQVLQRRGEWLEVQLANDIIGWLPASSVAAI